VTSAEGEKPAAAEHGLAAGLGATSEQTKPGTPMTPGGPAGATSASRAAATADAATADAATAAARSAAPAASGGKRTLATRALERVPLKWLSSAALVVFLGVTALFGGLEPAPSPETPVIAAGETFVGAEVEMTPVRAILVDKLNATGIFPTPGEQRSLSVILDARNLSEFARLSSVSSVLDPVRVDGLSELIGEQNLTPAQTQEGISPSIARLDDGTLGPWLQPGLPVRLVLTWAVPADAFSDGDTMRIALPTGTRAVGQSVIYGVYWDAMRTGAYADIVIDDRGEGDAQ